MTHMLYIQALLLAEHEAEVSVSLLDNKDLEIASLTASLAKLEVAGEMSNHEPSTTLPRPFHDPSTRWRGR